MGTLAIQGVAKIYTRMELENLVRERLGDVPGLLIRFWDVWTTPDMLDNEEVVAFLEKAPNDAHVIEGAFSIFRKRNLIDTEKEAFYNFVWTCVYKGFPG